MGAAMGAAMFFNWPGKKKQPALPAPAEQGAEKKSAPAFEAPAIARTADRCRTRAFATMGPQSDGVTWLEGFQLASRGNKWRLVEVSLTRNLIDTDISPDKILRSREIIKEDLSFLEALMKMEEFEESNGQHGYKLAQSGQEDPRFLHYRKLALQEELLFDLLGRKFVVTKDGQIPDEGSFLEEDVIALLRMTDSALKKEETPRWKSGLLSDIFGSVSSTLNFDQVLSNLETRGHLLEYALAAEEARGCLLQFQAYFADPEARGQQIDKWVESLAQTSRNGLLPDQFAQYKVNVKDILESDAFKTKLQNEPGRYGPLAEKLGALAAEKIGDIEARFFGSVKRAEGAIPEQEPELQKTLREFTTALCAIFYIFKAKAQYEFILHVEGDVSRHIDSLKKLLGKAAQAYKELGLPEDEINSIHMGLLTDKTPPAVPEFIAQTIHTFRARANDLLPPPEKGPGAPMEQMPLDLQGGEAGFLPYKENIDLLALLKDVRQQTAAKQDEHLAEILKSNTVSQTKSFGPVPY